MQKNQKVRFSVGLAIVMAGFTLAYVAARAPAELKIAPGQTVIVESATKLEGATERLGSSDFYRLDAEHARQLAEERTDVTLHLPQDYHPALSVNDPLELQDYLNLLDAPLLWDSNTGSSDITVAVIDSGFALEHEDLAGRWLINDGENGATTDEGPTPNCTSQSLPLDKNCNNLDDDANGFIDDWQGWDFAYDDNDPSAGSVDPVGDGVGHGTAVSGMVGATGNNGLGVASLNWQAKILPLQIFADDGSATTVEVAEALDYAIALGVDVVNLSLGSTGADPAVESLLEQAASEGILVVASAGNCGGSNYLAQGCNFQGQTLYPATSDYTVAIAATDLNDERAGFSSWGDKVDITAPGSGAISTTLYDKDDPAGAYSGSLFGTSFSAPLTSGMAASLIGLWPAASPADIRAVMIDSTEKLIEMDGEIFTQEHGFGRVEPLAAAELTEACASIAKSEDTNCDGNVGLLDLSFLVGQWELARAGRTDINQSGLTDLLDLSALVGQWEG